MVKNFTKGQVQSIEALITYIKSFEEGWVFGVLSGLQLETMLHKKRNTEHKLRIVRNWYALISDLELFLINTPFLSDLRVLVKDLENELDPKKKKKIKVVKNDNVYYLPDKTS